MKIARVTNYRSIKDLQLAGLDQVNILVGQSATGKSSVLCGLREIARLETPTAIIQKRNGGRPVFDDPNNQNIPNNSKYDEITSFVQLFVDNNIEKFDVCPSDYVTVKLKGDQTNHSLSQIGGSVEIVFNVMRVILNLKEGAVFIDDFGDGLSPFVINSLVIRMLAKLPNIQLFIATNSKEVVGTFLHYTGGHGVSIYTLRKNRKGGVEAMWFGGVSSHAAVEACDIDYRRIWDVDFASPLD